MRTIALTLGLVGFVIACSSTSSTGSQGEGDGGDTDGATSDGGGADGQSSGCPAAAPSAGDACSLPNGTTCHYGTCGIVTDATCDGSTWSVSKAGIDCASDGGSGGDTGADANEVEAGVACGSMNDAGEEQAGTCGGGMTCCAGGAAGSYYCTFTDGGRCPLVP
jgi:hypothetical protein